jgi:hypothetical protein
MVKKITMPNTTNMATPRWFSGAIGSDAIVYHRDDALVEDVGF